MKIGKILCVVLAVVLILSLVTFSVGAATPKLFISPSTYTATMLGESFTVNINISNIQDLKRFSLKLGYNTTLLDVMYALVNPWYDNAVREAWLVDVHEQQGYVRCAVNYSQAGTGNGTLASVTFKATYAASASCSLHLYETALYNSNGNPITHTLQDGNYKFVIAGVNVATDKPTYSRGENVKISGNLMLGSSPFNGLLALEADDPNGFLILARTLKLITSPPTGNFTILNLYSCDGFGMPKTSFHRGIEKAYFNVTFINNGVVPRNVTIVANAYDKNATTLGVGLNMIFWAPPGISYVLPSITVPAWAALGNATVYASLFTNLPRAGGTPYCPEKSATFQIIDGTPGGGAGAPPGGGTPENYNLTFRLSSDVSGTSNGIYKTYAAFHYQGHSLVNSTVFGVKPIICVPNPPYTTIQAGVNAANSTVNSILVLPGTYNEHVIINKTLTNRILTLVGVNQNSTIINGGGTGTVVIVTANNAKISRFTMRNSGSLPNSGVAIKNSVNITISENKITSNNGYGMKIQLSSENDIFDNTLSNNNYGIYLTNSTNIILRRNSLIGNKYNFGVFGDSLSKFIQDIDTSNKVEGKPIYYLTNKQNQEIPSDAGFVAVVNSREIAVRSPNLYKNAQGVLFAFTNDSVIERVNTKNNYYGIYMVNSSGNVIIGSTVSNNSVGIYQSYSNGNTICYNSFANNTNQLQSYQSSNTWDDGAGKGNYWSTYTGQDTDGDGVGETLVPHQGVDWYPLMEPWNSGNAVHNIAITNVARALPYNASRIYPGWLVTITVTVKNKGDSTETFLTITAYYDGTPIYPAKTITVLPPLRETTINFTWNTASVSPGTNGKNYTIRAVASIVPGETNTSDNTFTDGTVKVNLIGDASNDGYVGGLDIGIIGIALFTSPGEPLWNPYADVTQDGYVGGIDVGIAGIHLFEGG